VLPLYEWLLSNIDAMDEYRQPRDERAARIPQMVNSHRKDGDNLFERFERSLSSISQIRPLDTNELRHPQQPLRKSFGKQRKKVKEKKRMTTKELLDASQLLITFEDKLRRQILSRESQSAAEPIDHVNVPNFIKLRVASRSVSSSTRHLMEAQETYDYNLMDAHSILFTAMQDMKTVQFEKQKAKCRRHI
jgi:hypothetical protein